MNNRALNFLLAAATLTLLIGNLVTGDSARTEARALDVRLQVLERNLAAANDATAATRRRLDDLKASLPTHRWNLQPGLPGMEVMVPIYVVRPPEAPKPASQ